MLSADGKIIFVWERKNFRTQKQQQILDMKNAGMKHEEIAELLGVKTSAINQLSHRAQKRTSRNTLRTGTVNV